MKATHRIMIEVAARDIGTAQDIADSIATAMDEHLRANHEAVEKPSKHDDGSGDMTFYKLPNEGARATPIMIVPLEDGDNID